MERLQVRVEARDVSQLHQTLAEQMDSPVTCGGVSWLVGSQQDRSGSDGRGWALKARIYIILSRSRARDENPGLD